MNTSKKIAIIGGGIAGLCTAYWLKKNGHQITYHQKQILISILITAVSLSSVAQTGRVHLPELGNSASDVLSNSEEREYAQGLIRQMRAYELLNT